MNPTLAGFFVPGLVILALMALPYLDRGRSNVGTWFESSRGRRVCLWSAIYAVVIEIGLILFDTFVTWQTYVGGSEAVRGWIIPIAVNGLAILVLYLALRRWKSTGREVALGLFAAFVVTYFTLTITTQFFRGSGMHLIPFWQLPPGGLTF